MTDFAFFSYENPIILYCSLWILLSFALGEEEAVPAKKTKTIVSTAQITQATRQARIEKVCISKRGLPETLEVGLILQIFHEGSSWCFHFRR